MPSASLSKTSEHGAEAMPRTSLGRLCGIAPTTRCAMPVPLTDALTFFSEGGKTMCSCALCLPTGCATKDTVGFVGQPSGVLDDIRLRCRLSCYRVCCSSCRFFAALAIGAATGGAQGYRGMPRGRSQDRVKVPDGWSHPWLCSAVRCNVSMPLRSGATCDIISSAR